MTRIRTVSLAFITATLLAAQPALADKANVQVVAPAIVSGGVVTATQLPDSRQGQRDSSADNTLLRNEQRRRQRALKQEMLEIGTPLMNVYP